MAKKTTFILIAWLCIFPETFELSIGIFERLPKYKPESHPVTDNKSLASECSARDCCTLPCKTCGISGLLSVAVKVELIWDFVLEGFVRRQRQRPPAASQVCVLSGAGVVVERTQPHLVGTGAVA